MASGGKGADDARAATELNSQLFRDYANVGAPALGSALQYARGDLARGGLPAYVEGAYRQAQVGALEQSVQDFGGLRRSIAARSGAGGQYLSSLTGGIGSAGDAFTREVAGIRTSRALAGVEQRNKMLGILAGGAATATNLSAGFGGLGNQAISLNRQPDQTYGLVTGGLSAGLGLYSALNQKPTSNLGFDPETYAASRAGSGQLLFPMP